LWVYTATIAVEAIIRALESTETVGAERPWHTQDITAATVVGVCVGVHASAVAVDLIGRACVGAAALIAYLTTSAGDEAASAVDGVIVEVGAEPSAVGLARLTHAPALACAKIAERSIAAYRATGTTVEGVEAQVDAGISAEYLVFWA